MNAKKYLRILVSVLAVSLSIASCSDADTKKDPSSDNFKEEISVTETSTEPNASLGESNADVETSGDTEIPLENMFTDRDSRTDYDSAKAIHITLNGDSISCNSNAVTVSGSTVTIKTEGTYVLSGTLTNGMIIVDTEESDKPQIVLNGVTINSATSAPIYVRSANKVFITLKEGSENTLKNGGSFTAIDDNNIDSVVFSKSDLTLNGNGKLNIDSPAGHGVVSKDDLAITGGIYTINSASHAVSANNSVRIADITATITAGKDGIQADHDTDTSKGFVYIANGSFGITSGQDGISASGVMQIDGGVFKITSGGGGVNVTKPGYGGGFPGFNVQVEDSVSMKGIKAVASITVNGGKFTLDTADDAVHSNSNIAINSGDFEISTGDDGFHADDTLTLDGGVICIDKSYEGLEALNVLVNNGKISLIASDDGINAAGGTDSSGMGGNFGGDNFAPGGRPAKPGKREGGPMSAGNGSVVISGGDIYIKASGDGIDANGTLKIEGGNVVVCGPTTGDTATLDFDRSGTISGGIFVGTGASGGMVQNFSQSEQAVISLRVGNQSAGTEIVVKDLEGNILISHMPELSFGLIIFSAPELVKGQSYTISIGGTEITATAN